MERAPFLFLVSLLFSTGPWAQGGLVNTIPPSGTPQPAPPLPPYGVFVEPDEEDPTKVTIHWSPGSPDHSGFIVERSQSSSAFTPVASTGATATEAEDQGLYADRRYKYRVRAFKDIPDGRRLFSASSFSQPYQAPVFKSFSGKFTSDTRKKYGFRPLIDTQDRSERYLEHVLWANYQYEHDHTFAFPGSTYTTWENEYRSYYRESLTQRWHGEYVASGQAHTEYELKDFSTNSGPVFHSLTQFAVEVQTHSDGSKYGQWMKNDTNGAIEVPDPIELAYPYGAVEPDTLTPVSASYSVESVESESISEGGSSITSLLTLFGSADESLSEKFPNVTFANEVIEDAPALDDQPSVPIPAPWDPNYLHLASRMFYDWQEGFWFTADFCVKDIETHPCDGSDYDYVVAKQTSDNEQGAPEIEYTLTSLQLSGSSTKIEPIDVTEDLVEEDADGMIAQNVDWSVRVAPKLLAYDSPWALDEFEKVSPGLVVGTHASSSGAIVLNGAATTIDNVTYTLEWDSSKFEVISDSEVLSSPYVVTAEIPRDYHFSIHAKEQANLAASTTFRMKAETDGGTVGDDEVRVCILPIEVITINTFIPHNNVDNPVPFSGSIFEGDNRHGGSPDRATWNEHGSHRTQIKFQVVAWNLADTNGLLDNAYANDSDGVKNDEYFVSIGTTHEYDKASSLDSSGNLTAAAKADTTLADGHLKIKEGTAPKSEVWIEKTEFLAPKKVAITCRCEASNPLVSLSFLGPISYTFVITIDKTDPSAPRYSLTGKCKNFPAYEVYINGKRVYQYDPLVEGRTPSWLLLPPTSIPDQIDEPLP